MINRIFSLSISSCRSCPNTNTDTNLERQTAPLTFQISKQVNSANSYRSLRTTRNQRMNTPQTSRSRHSAANSLRAGFTLVELLLTLAVLVTVAAVAMVPLAKWQRSMPLDQSIALLQKELTATRLLAIDEAAFYTVTFDANATTFTRTCTSRHTDNEQTFRLFEGTTFVAQDKTETRQIVFQSDGTVSNSTVILQDTNGVRAALKLERLTGLVRIADASTLSGGPGA